MPRAILQAGPLRRVALVAALLLAGAAVAASSLPESSAGAGVPHRQHPPRAATAAHRNALKLIWGPVVLPNGQSAFPTYRQLGVDVFQMDLDWAQTSPTRPADPQNPNDPAYHWPADVDQAVQAAGQNGVRILLLVKDSPPWANGNRAAVWAPNDPADYANFLIAAARHYSTVHYWMVWGEPNRDQQPDFQPMPVNSPVGPRRYAILLNAGYHALKQVSRSNLVIGGDTWSFGTVQPADFVKWMRLPNGQPPPLDYYGHNPFGRRFPNLKEKPYVKGGRDINDIDTLESQLKNTYHRQVKLWLSEFTISSVHSNYAFDFHTSLKGQARWLTAAFRLANSVPYVVGMGWFNLLDSPETGPVSQQLTSGLLTWTLKRKPSYYAYRHAR
jgi:hypothetical protein